MRSCLLIGFFGLIVHFGAVAQNPKSTKPSDKQSLDRPKLVVGIVVDQMRYDFLYRYYEKYSAGGFKRMLREGYSFANCNYSYFPTKTAPGHASIFTGTTPAVHGVVGNDWFETKTGKGMHCVQDDSVTGIGGDENNGKKSPVNLQSYTIADQIKLATNFKGKSYGISLKDRGAILPAGHSADAAFWFDPITGNFISSSYYKKLNGKLPEWLDQFNQKKRSDFYKKQVWNTLLPIETYTESSPDLSDCEASIIQDKSPVFPYSLSESKRDFGIVKNSPFGNTLLLEAANALISGEKLGKGSDMDFLSISFSSTDDVGHDYGPYAIETEDTYLRLDRDLENLFLFLDKEIGKGKYVTFLTADHGIVEVPSYLIEKSLPAGYFSRNQFLTKLKSHSLNQFDSLQLIRHYINEQVFLDNDLIKEKKLDRKKVVSSFVEFIKNQSFISNCFAYQSERPFPEIPFISKFEAGYFNGRSGDIQLMFKPGVLERSSKKGTNHGSPYSYDSHVPCLFMGWKIKPGEATQPIKIEDITPSLSTLLHIMEPNGSTGTPQFIPTKP